MKASERIICALDLADPQAARRIVDSLDGLLDFFKVGMLLYLTGGREIVNWLLARNKRVFLDLKLYDVPDTVAPAVRQAAELGISFLTVHGNHQIIEKAALAAAGTQLQLLAVTVLTSLDQADLQKMGFTCQVEDLVLYRAREALRCGCSGVVASAREAALLRRHLGSQLLIVTPGIRPAGVSIGGHKRAATPAEALQAGADYLVIGQPIINADDRPAAVRSIIDELSLASMQDCPDKPSSAGRAGGSGDRL